MQTISSKTLPVSLLVSGLYGALYTLLSQDLLTALWFGIGLALGYTTLVFDELWLFKRYADANKPHGGGLITRSIAFMAVFLALSVFVITSSASLIGTGVIVAMGTLLSIELWRTRDNRDQFIAIFTPLHPEQFNEKQRQQVTAVFITVFVGLLCWALLP
jgi:hypothetical protein